MASAKPCLVIPPRYARIFSAVFYVFFVLVVGCVGLRFGWHLAVVY
jgi:hypothetical protein